MQPSGGGGSPDDRCVEQAPDGSLDPGAVSPGGTRASYYLHLAEDVPEDVLNGLFGELRRLQPERDGAVLVGAARDPEELVGIMARLSMLGFSVLEVRRAVQPGNGSGQCRSPGSADSPRW
jgi:hypothetical protein